MQDDKPYLTPGALSEKLMMESATYGSLTDQLIAILERKSGVWMEIRKGTASDTSADRAFGATPDGLQETTLRLRLKAIEKGMSAIRTRLRIMDTEAKNMY